MVSQDRIERERYESLRKAERDRASELLDAYERGYKKGLELGALERGCWIGQIQVCERLLKLPESPRDRFDNVPYEDLIALANRLAEQVEKGRA